MPATANLKTTSRDEAGEPRRFEFARDSFAFANELLWEYRFDPATGKTAFSKREPKPTYAHRCFVLVRAVRQFLYHAQFSPERQRSADDAIYRRAIREVMSRNPRVGCAAGDRIVIPGFASLREFSLSRAQLLKENCGGAWQSYVLRSHWRMILPISRAHQARTAARLLAEIRNGRSPIIHLVLFPKLTINHGMILFEARESDQVIVFQAYDPNVPEQPIEISFDRATRHFSLPPNRYWAGGRLNVLEIYRDWFM